ncbi:MAG: hypothetical protein R3F11_19630 [Verrucomicrobiales bacterium]
MIRLSRALSPLLALTLAAVLANCSTSQKGTGGEIVKASYYKLDAAKRVYAADPAIPFEQKHYLHGAVTREEQTPARGTTTRFSGRRTTAASRSTPAFNTARKGLAPPCMKNRSRWRSSAARTKRSSM